MATDIVVDYLGHPCKIAEAFSLFKTAVQDAHEVAEEDPRALYRQIGIAMVEANERMQRLVPALDAALAVLPNSTDSRPATTSTRWSALPWLASSMPARSSARKEPQHERRHL